MNYTRILKEFTRKKILVIGDLILDRYIWGKVDRISPEAPVPIVEVTKEDFLLGGASNVAHNIVTLGGSTSIVGVTGNDRAGDVLMNLLEKQGIQSQGVVSSALIREVLKTAKPFRIFVSVDPKVGHFKFYKGVSLITPNLAEASFASKIEIKDEKSLINAGKNILKTLSCDAVLITRGEQGMSLFEKEKVTHIPTVTKDVYDVNAAG